MSGDLRKRSPLPAQHGLPHRDRFLAPPFRQSKPDKTTRNRWFFGSTSSAALLLVSLVVLGRGWLFKPDFPASPMQPLINKLTSEDLEVGSPQGEVLGHGDFDDGRKCYTKKEFVDPESQALNWVNVQLGNGGPTPDLSGGMIPAVAPPFAMTRWTAQTRQNYVSMCPFNQTDSKIHGFLGTHQPAVWMGESGPAQISVGLGRVITDFDSRGLPFKRENEYSSPNYYSNVLDAGARGCIHTELSATSRVGHLRFTFDITKKAERHIVIQASRPSILINAENTPIRATNNISYPQGWVKIDKARNEIYGWNDERQDHILVGDDLPATSFKGYFVARFSAPIDRAGVSFNGEAQDGTLQAEGKSLAAYATFGREVRTVEARVGVSFISIDQARRNLDLEVPNEQTLEETSRSVRRQWADKLDSLSVSGATPHNLTVLYTSFAHTLVYPYEIHENTGTHTLPTWHYYSGYQDRMTKGFSYSGFSIWDTFRAQTAWLFLLTPERAADMITSMLQDYKEGGRLPMWKNLVETNIMVGTHGDAIIAQAMNAGVQGFDWDLAWQAVRKDAFAPPDRDAELRFADREEHTPQEVRAGLTEYMQLGHVADDLHSESGSRTLDYAYDDWAASIVAEHVGAEDDAQHLRRRARSYVNLWNAETGFMEARNTDGSWAGGNAGWTEGDHWAYSLTVMHDVPGLIDLMGGNKSFVDFMDRHFDGGHNLHTNEPSHHIPYLYMYAGVPHKTQERVYHIGQNEYNHTAGGLSGNEDCGQMSAWYLFSAMGFYPVDPASATYVIGAPFFDSLTLRLPGASRPLNITAIGASDGRRYVKSVTMDGKRYDSITIHHQQIADGADIVFEMDSTPQVWGV